MATAMRRSPGPRISIPAGLHAGLRFVGRAHVAYWYCAFCWCVATLGWAGVNTVAVVDAAAGSETLDDLIAHDEAWAPGGLFMSVLC